MSEAVTVEKIEEIPMASTNKGEVKTNIRVPKNKYELLNDIKKETGTPINALVVEGVDLVLLKYEPVLKEAIKKAEQKANKVQDILSEIKEK